MVLSAVIKRVDCISVKNTVAIVENFVDLLNFT